jgi:hypothetical protein
MNITKNHTESLAIGFTKERRSPIKRNIALLRMGKSYFKDRAFKGANIL